MVCSATRSPELTVMRTRLYSFPILVGVPNKIGVSSGPPLYAPRVESSSRLLLKILKVLSVQGVFDCGLVGGFRAVQVVPVNAVEEGVVLQSHTALGAKPTDSSKHETQMRH